MLLKAFVSFSIEFHCGYQVVSGLSFVCSTGINRWLHSIIGFMEYQQSEEGKLRNSILKDEHYDELYAEIDRMLPYLKNCLAPKKVAKKTGAQSLRSGIDSAGPAASMDEAKIKAAASHVYDWLDHKKPSKVRMLATYQAAGGQSFVCHVFHRAVQSFLQYGESNHASGKGPVSKESFTSAIVCRHSQGNSGIFETDSSGIDFDLSPSSGSNVSSNIKSGKSSSG